MSCLMIPEFQPGLQNTFKCNQVSVAIMYTKSHEFVIYMCVYGVCMCMYVFKFLIWYRKVK